MIEKNEGKMLLTQLCTWISKFIGVEVDRNESYHLRAPINRFAYHNKTVYRFPPTCFAKIFSQ